MDIQELYRIFQNHPNITTDSRNIAENSIFFALKGERFDGNNYIEQALQKGAAYAVGDRKNLLPLKRIIVVDNVLHTLQLLANYHRRKMKAKVIAITGTNGKTTTKELLAAALSSKYNVLYTQGNQNNHIGVPLTLLRMKEENEFAIIEMGANHQGEIYKLCRIADPDYGLITNVGRAHLEGFGSFEILINSKAELYDYLRIKNGIAFCNTENMILSSLHKNIPTIYYGTDNLSFVQGKLLESSPFLNLEWKKDEDDMNTIRTRLIGSYNFENALAAICIASYFNVEDEKINHAIAQYTPDNNRSQNKKTARNQLIIDAYNANPSSMKVALDNFASLDVFPKMVILGEMNELGIYSEQEHRKIIHSLILNKFESVVLVGKEFTKIQPLPMDWKVFERTEDMLHYLTESNINGFSILIKGSRSNQLEKSVECL
ncbi:MAG: UDP-N-acetylmuramoyl-tripeptide--D-alanyl-D-alanine ligase [Dysgonamonadaceae bacterium]|jgi:UDP-N-acetylmuramoyl-tripeptide--D-alanyl-D-alanine ligase|nr:UDP-N-acetylmuramoyl-tripeptide--D-alanyl-D-alanine ligase [Dysgonamonadaceae bacterium]